MSRSLSNDVVTEINSAETQPILLFEGEFISGFFRAWSGFGDLSWGGFTWQGAGTLMGISPIDETAEVSAQGITVSLSGIPSGMLSLVLSDVQQNAPGKVWIGFLNNGAVIADPVLLFEGRLDVPSIDDSGETASISITYESRLIDLSRPRVSRYTDEEQKREFPSDVGCEFVADLQEKTLNWGRA